MNLRPSPKVAESVSEEVLLRLLVGFGAATGGVRAEVLAPRALHWFCD